MTRPVPLPHRGQQVEQFGECRGQRFRHAALGEGVKSFRDLVEIDADAAGFVVDVSSMND